MRIVSIRELVLTRDNEVVRDEEVDTPANVTATNFVSFLETKHGAVTDTAWSTFPDIGNVTVGIVFNPADIPPEHDLIAIPLIDVEGERVPLFETLAVERAMFEELAVTKRIKGVDVVSVEQEEWAPMNRTSGG